MRVSAVQKDILFVLYQLELRGFLKPIPATDILTMLNKSRVTEVFGQTLGYLATNSMRMVWSICIAPCKRSGFRLR